MEESTGHTKQIVATLAVLIIVAVIAGGAVVAGRGDEGANTSTDTGAKTTQTANQNATYQDGTYQATGGYMTPAGSETIAISVTLQDGVITDTSAINKATDAEAKQNQQDFIDNYKQKVIGKKLSQVSLDRVSGSSLTSQGFNNAIQQIRNKAEV